MQYVKALVVLQFHLLRHTLTRGKIVAYFVMGCIGGAALVFAAVLAGLFYFLGAAWFPEQPRAMALLALNMLLLIYVIGWFWGIVMEVQRSDVIDIKKMLHFPVPLPLINGINFGVSLIGFTSLFYLSGALGLLAGLWRSHGHGLIPGALASGAFFLAASAWAYYVRGLLAVWMTNKRRRRLLLSILPLFFSVVGFMPMLLTNSFDGGQSGEVWFRWLNEPAQFTWVERASWCLPTGWLALTLSSIMAGKGPVFAPIAALLCLGALGYWLGYRVTVRYCFGSGTGGGAPAARPGEVVRPPFTARRIPWLADDTAALTLAAFLSFTRHPQMRTMLLAPISMIIFIAIANSRSTALGHGVGVPAIVVIFPFFMFSAFFCNLFGMDPRGFRAIMMLPPPRYRVLLAYHLALFPLAGGMGMAFILLGAWFYSMSASTVAVSLLQILQLFLLFSMTGSFVSIYAPFAIGRNMMRGHKSRSLLVGLLMPLIVALLVIPTSICLLVDGITTRWGLGGYPVGLVLSALLIALTLAVYPFALRQAGDLLLLREQRILAALQKTAE